MGFEELRVKLDVSFEQ